MEIIFTTVGVIIGGAIVLACLDGLNNKLKSWSSSINWVKFLGIFIIGSILLAVIFSFTAEGVLVILGFYAALMVISLLFGAFSSTKSNGRHKQRFEQVRYEIAKNLLDVLDDEAIAIKTGLSVDEVKSLRSESSLQ